MNARFMVIGYLSVLLLAVLTMGVAAVGVGRIERQTLELADDSQRTTYYLGQVGEQLARLRSHISLGLGESPGEFSQHDESISKIESNLNSALHHLRSGTAIPKGERWERLWTEIDRMGRVYEEASVAISEGRSSRAQNLVRENALAVTAIHDSLENLAQVHRKAVLAQLRSVHRDASRAVLLEFILAGVFFVGMTVIWRIMTTTLRRQRRLIAQHTADLESANADLDAFAGRVAHDLRNALHPIVVGGAVLEQSRDPSVISATIDRMQRSSRKAVALVDALLLFSRTSQSSEVGESGSLPEAVDGVLEELAPEIARVGVEIVVGSIPDLRIRCSPGLLHIVLVNLCGNAVKFLEGEPRRSVSISAHQEDSWCEIAVEDTGPGIPEEALPRIFEPFYRVGGKRAPGAGLGLATVRRIVERRGGRILADCPKGHGTRFRVWLPLAEPSQPPET